MKTPTEVAAKTPIPQCGLQGNNLIIAPDKGQTRFTAWIITRDQAGSETMVSNCLEIPMIGIGDTAPPIIKEHIVDQFTWINGHPYVGVDYFLQVFAYDDKNVQSEPEEIKLITKQADKPASPTTPPSVASKPATKTPPPVQNILAPQGWIDWMCKWLQMWVEPVLAQLAEKRPSKKLLREIPQFTQNFLKELSDLKEAHPSDPQVTKVCEMFKKFEVSVTELSKMWDAQEKQREEAAKARPVPTPQPAPVSSPVHSLVPPAPKPETAPTKPIEPPKTLFVAPQEALEQIWVWLASAKKALEGTRANAVTLATMRLEDSQAALESIRDKYPDTEAKKILGIEEEIASLESILEQFAQAEEAREKQARDAETAARETEEKAEKEKGGKKKDEKKDSWYKRAPKAVWNWISNLGGRIGSKWPLLLLLLGLFLLWWFFGRDNKGTNVVPPVQHSSAPTGNTESATPPAPAFIPTQATNEVAKAIEKALPALTNAHPGTTLNLNSAQSITVSNTFGNVRGNNNSIVTGNGQANVTVNYNISSNSYNYYGLGPKGQAGKQASVQIPETLTCKPVAGGYHWTTNLVAGQVLPYKFDRSRYDMRVVSDAAQTTDLTTQIKGLDGEWHEIIAGNTNRLAGTEYQFSVSATASRPVELECWLTPKAH